MNTEENKNIVRHYVQEIYEKGNIAVAKELLADNYLCYDPGREQPAGRDATIQELKDFRAAFPELQLGNPEYTAQGDTVSVRLTLEGTHRGSYAGMPATGKWIKMPFTIHFRVSDGKIVEERDEYDAEGFMRQLSGTLPATA